MCHYDTLSVEDLVTQGNKVYATQGVDLKFSERYLRKLSETDLNSRGDKPRKKTYYKNLYQVKLYFEIS